MKGNHLKTQLIRQTLGLIFGIFLLISLVTSLIFYQSNKENHLKQNERVLSLMNLQAKHFLEHPEEEMKLVESALSKSEDQETRQSEVLFILERFAYIYRVEHLDATGKIISTFPVQEELIGLDYSKHPVYTGAKEKQAYEFVFGGTFIDPVEEHPSVTMTMKARDGSQIVGYINLDHLNEIYEKAELHNMTYAVLDENGYYLLYLNKKEVIQRELNPNFTEMKNGALKNGAIVVHNKKKSILQFQEIPATGWTIVIYQDIQEMIQPILLSLSHIILAFFVFGFGMFFTINHTLGKIERALLSFIRMTEKVSEGHYQLDESQEQYSEFEELTDNFRKMTGEVQIREEKIYSLNTELEQSYLNTVFLLAKTIEAKDSYTGDHCDRVTQYALMIGKKIGLEETEMRELSNGSLLHDIGKLSIPETILTKPGRLSQDEYQLIKQHSSFGYNLIKEIPKMEKAKEIVLYHHERYDGKGYPEGLKGDAIPLMARIVCIADAFDAMTSERVYRDFSFSREEAIEELKQNRNSQFDGELVNAFIECLKTSVVES